MPLRIAEPIGNFIARLLHYWRILQQGLLPRRAGPLPHDYHAGELGREIKDPLTPSTEGHTTESRYILFPKIEPVLAHIRPDLLPLQRKTAEVLFAQLGIDYVPGLMLDELRRFDVRYAFAVFVERFGLQYGVLITPDYPEHSTQRDALESIVGFLLDVEESSKGSVLSPMPLYDVLARSFEAAEGLLDRFQQAVSVARSIEAGEIEFPKYLEFRKRVQDRLRKWHEIPPEELADIFVINHEYVKLQEQFHTLLEQLRDCIAWLLSNISRAGEDKAVILEMIDVKETVETEIYDGRREPDEGVSQLENILYDLTDVAYAFGFESAFTEERESVGPFTMADYCKTLGVSEVATLDEITKAFRKLAIACHPDRNPGNKEAEERFKEINDAYQALRGHFKTI